MSQINVDQISSTSSVDTFAPVAIYRLKYYEPESIFDNVLYALIRPPRFVYNQRLLIPGRKYHLRYDYQVHNIPFPLSIYWAQNPKYIILYLHGNSSSRFEGYLHLKELPEGACLACFDFKGCGLRKDGKFITLGKQQSIEVDIAIEYLSYYGYPIIGWGRSMGAVSLLMSSKCEIMIADSPFSSLYDLCKQTTLNFLPSPLCCLVHCMFPCLFSCVRSGVEKKSGMDPSQLEIIKAVEKLCPSKSLLIMAGKQDSMIHYSHAQKLHNAFRGEQKKLILFDGTHNSNRPEQVFQQCFSFIESCIQKRSSKRQKILKPFQHDTVCKVFKMDRKSSKSSLSNLQANQSSDIRQFQSSKQTLISSNKAPIQLKPLRIGPSKTSPKKLSRILGDSEINQEADISINHQESIVRQGIGKFEKQMFKNQRQSFKEISLKNQLQDSKKSIQLKNVKPFRELRYEETEQNLTKKPLLTFSDNFRSAQFSFIQQNKEQKVEIRKERQLLLVSKDFSRVHADELLTMDSKQIPPINSQESAVKKIHLELKMAGTPHSQQSSLFYQDVKLIEQEQNQNSVKDDQMKDKIKIECFEGKKFEFNFQKQPQKTETNNVEVYKAKVKNNDFILIQNKEEIESIDL